MERGKAEDELGRTWPRLCRRPTVFDGLTYTYEDDRFAYGEQRFVTLGLLNGMVVSVVHTETTQQIRVISLRKATRHEQAIFFKSVQD